MPDATGTNHGGESHREHLRLSQRYNDFDATLTTMILGLAAAALLICGHPKAIGLV